MDAIGSMLSVPVSVLPMPSPLLALLFMCRKLGQKLARNEWCCCPVLVHNSWGYTPSFYEPITGADSFDVFGIEECSSADWNAESRVNTLNMSQHCLVMIANSKQ